MEACAEAVGRENVCITTSPTKCPESLAGKLEWIHGHFPEWMHRQYAITPRKHLFARADSLLIDDHSENIERFEAHGGHAILVPRPWNPYHGIGPMPAFAYRSIQSANRLSFATVTSPFAEQ